MFCSPQNRISLMRLFSRVREILCKCKFRKYPAEGDSTRQVARRDHERSAFAYIAQPLEGYKRPADMPVTRGALAVNDCALCRVINFDVHVLHLHRRTSAIDRFH